MVIDVRRFDRVIVQPGSIYESVNQGNVLSLFPAIYPSEPPTITVLYSTFHEDPVQLATDISDFVRIVESEISLVGVGSDEATVVTKRERCIQQQGPFDLRKLFPEAGSEVDPLVLIHLFSHILMFYAIRCIDPLILDLEDFTYAELVYRNKYNPTSEALVVFNFPAKTAHVAILADIILSYFNRWIQGKETDSFIQVMKAQAESNDLLRIT